MDPSRNHVEPGDHDAEEVLDSIVSAKSIGHNLRKHVKHFTEHHCKVRSQHGAITWTGYEHSKLSSKQRRKTKTDGHFTPANRPYAPIGGSLEPAKKNQAESASDTVAANMGREVIKSDKEQLRSSPVVPLNDTEGLHVEVPSYSYKFLQLRLSDINDVLCGRNVRLPFSLVIKMVDVRGNPDMYIVPDVQFNKLGIPGKDKFVWKTKTFVEVLPFDPNYTLGTYYMRVSCGVDASKFKVVAATYRHTPTIDKAIRGPGHGYRPNEKEKREDIGRNIVSKAIQQSDQRRRKGYSGNFPMSHVPMPSYFRKEESTVTAPSGTAAHLSPAMPGSDQPSKTQISALVRQATLARSLSRRHLHGRPATALGLTHQKSQLSFEVSQERPRSALERAVEATFRSTMDKLKYDYDNLEVQEIRVHDFFSVLKPKKIDFTHLNQNKKQRALLFGGEHSDLNDISAMDGEASSADVDPAMTQARANFRSPLRKGRGISGFKDELMALLRSTGPITRKLRDYEYVQMSVPVSLVSGYAVVAEDGPGKDRKLVYRREGKAEEVKSGQAMTVVAGSQVPDGADAVVEAKNVTKLRLQTTTNLNDRSVPIAVSDLPVVGQNIRSEDRPFFVGGGTFIPARDYCQIRYPHVLGEFDTIFRAYFSATKEAGEGEPAKAQGDTAVQDEVAQVVLMAIDASPSKLLQSMKAKERKQLAQNCKVHVVHSRTVLVTQRLCEEVDGEQARSMFLLISGEMGVYLEDDGSYADSAEAGWDAFDDTDRKRRRLLGSDSSHGALFGERQLLFGDAWPCTLIGMTTCKVAEVPLFAFTDVIFARPDLLNGMRWRRREEGFTSSQNHSTLLGIMRHQEPAGQPTRSRSPSPTASERGSALSEHGDEELRTMMRLDTNLIKEAIMIKQYNEEMDELIAEGALNPQQLALVLAERKEQEARENARLKPVERGARGDAVCAILQLPHDNSQGDPGSAREEAQP